MRCGIEPFDKALLELGHDGVGHAGADGFEFSLAFLFRIAGSLLDDAGSLILCVGQDGGLHTFRLGAAFFKKLGAFGFDVGDLTLDFGQMSLGFLLAAGQIVHFLDDFFAAARKERFQFFARGVPDDADEDSGIDDAQQEVDPRETVAVACGRNLARNEDKSAGCNYTIDFVVTPDRICVRKSI